MTDEIILSLSFVRAGTALRCVHTCIHVPETSVICAYVRDLGEHVRVIRVEVDTRTRLQNADIGPEIACPPTSYYDELL